MIKNALKGLGSASKVLVRRWTTLVVLLVLHLALIGAVYFFFLTRDATIGQVITTAALVLAAPVLFFVMQTIVARYTVDESGTWRLLVGGLRDFWKLFVVAIPLMAVAILILLWIAGATSEPATAASATGAQPARPTGQGATDLLDWGLIVIRAFEYLMLLLILPLIAIQFWLSSARAGLKSTLKNIHRLVGRSLSADAVVTYTIAFVVFAVVPYLLIVTKTPAGNAWVEGILLGGRLALAAFLSIAGWAVAVGGVGQLGSATGNVAASRLPGDALRTTALSQEPTAAQPKPD